MREVVQIIDDEEMEEVGSKKRPRFLGPIDKVASAINPDSSIDTSKRMQQQNISDALWKERTHNVHQFLARWVYEAGIPFYAIDNDSFKRFVEAVGQFGPSYRSPSQYQFRLPVSNCSQEIHSLLSCAGHTSMAITNSLISTISLHYLRTRKYFE